MIYPEGQVWLCGRGLEEVQGLHYQQSSWIKQGEKIEWQMCSFIHNAQVPAMLHRWNTQSYTVEGEVARFVDPLS